MGMFGYQQIDETKLKLIELVNADAQGLVDRLKHVKDSRLKSMAITEIEKAIMVVNKAIAHGEIIDG